jgi:hypothetical protein
MQRRIRRRKMALQILCMQGDKILSIKAILTSIYFHNNNPNANITIIVDDPLQQLPFYSS